MPFVSNAQRRFMYAKHPEIAKEFEEKTTEETLPDHKDKIAALRKMGQKNGKNYKRSFDEH